MIIPLETEALKSRNDPNLALKTATKLTKPKSVSLNASFYMAVSQQNPFYQKALTQKTSGGGTRRQKYF